MECKYYYIQLCKTLTLLNIKGTLDNTKRAHIQSKKGHFFSFFQKWGGGTVPQCPPPQFRGPCIRALCYLYGLYMLHIRALCYIYGLYVTYTGSMLHIRALCYLYGLQVTYTGSMLPIGLYVTYTGPMLHIRAVCYIYGLYVTYTGSMLPIRAPCYL